MPAGPMDAVLSLSLIYDSASAEYELLQRGGTAFCACELAYVGHTLGHGIGMVAQWRMASLSRI